MEPDAPQRLKSFFTPLAIFICSFVFLLLGFFLGRHTRSAPVTSVPSPVPTSASKFSDWQAYTSSKYSFSFQYPKDADIYFSPEGDPKSFQLTYRGDKQRATGQIETDIFDGYFFNVTERGSATNFTIDQVAKSTLAGAKENCPPKATYTPITDTSVSGRPAKTYSVTGCLGDYTEYFVSNDEYVFAITQVSVGEPADQVAYQAATSQILTTFKFANSVTNTSNWQTYSNSAYQFSFQYPSSVTVEEHEVPGSYIEGTLFKPGKQLHFYFMAKKNMSPNEAKYFLDQEPIGQRTINGQLWQEFLLEHGYGDGPNSADGPVFGLQTLKNSILYSATFPDQSSTTPEQDQTLSTFQFTN